MSNILSFPTDRAFRNTEAHTDRVHRAQVLREQLKERPTLPASIRERLAENLHGLLVRLESEGRLRRSDLCIRVFGSSREESTKRLRSFALDPTKTGKPREAALSALAKKANKYIELAEAAAEMAGDDKDATILDLVHGTPLANAKAAVADDPLVADLRAPVLRTLELSARVIAERHGLQRAFKLIARFPERARDPLSDAFGDEPHPIVAGSINSELPYLEDGSMSPRSGEPGRDWWRLVNRSPKVLLGEVILVSIEQTPQFTKRPWRSKEERPAPPSGEVWGAKTDFRLQVQLGIFPFGPQLEPRIGLLLRLVREVQIMRTRLPVELRPLRRLPSNASPEAKTHREIRERLRKLVAGSDGRSTVETMHRERCDDLRHVPKCKAVEHEFHVHVTADLASLNNAHIDALLGRPVDENDSRMARVVALSSEVAREVLDLPDCGTISDWVGPVPDRLYSDRHPEPRPAMDDPTNDHWFHAAHEAGEDDRLYRFRFAGDGYGPVPEERFPLGWPDGALGYKLERSLLEISGSDSIAHQLSEITGSLSAEVEEEIGSALKAREARLAQLYRPTDE